MFSPELPNFCPLNIIRSISAIELFIWLLKYGKNRTFNGRNSLVLIQELVHCTNRLETDFIQLLSKIESGKI